MTGPSRPAPPSALDLKLKEGLLHHQNGQLAKAEAAYRHILQENPNHSIALCMLGIIAQAMNKHEQAIQLFSKSIEINPAFADAHSNLGAVFMANGQFSDALKCFTAALEIKPDYLIACVNHGIILQKLAQHDLALSSFQKAHRLAPHSPEVSFQLANQFRILNRNNEALDCCINILATNPNFIPAIELKGTLVQATGGTTEALTVFNQALSLNNGVPGLHINKANCLVILERYQEALESLDHALSLQPQNAVAHSSRGVLMRLLGKPIDAEKEFRAAIAIDPAYAEAHQNLSFALLDQGLTQEALEEYEWRWQIPNTAFAMRGYEKPVWDGLTDLSEKTILLWPEQGPGDIIIWAACIPEIIKRSKHCIINVYPKLVSLFERSFPGADVRPDTGAYQKSQNDFDVHIPMGSLFKCLKIAPTAQQDAYLIPNPARVAYWQKRLSQIGPGPYVGISWKGALITDARAPNYTQVTDWAQIMQSPAVFLNLQCGERSDEIKQFQDQYGATIHEMDDLDLYDGLDDVAAFCAALDVVISVSTAVSPIAAAVGSATWLLSWQQSPWNNFLLKARGPDVVVYERRTGAPWTPLFDRMAAQLQSSPPPLTDAIAKC